MIKKITLTYFCMSTPSYHGLFEDYAVIIRVGFECLYFSVIITFFCIYK